MTPEAHAAALVRLEAGRIPGVTLWRNNVGVLMDENGRPVRYGLANESPQMNAALKSHDYIGWRSVLITEQHVGLIMAQFLSREVKPIGWTYRGTAREQAQKAWGDLVTQAGGDAGFAPGPGTL